MFAVACNCLLLMGVMCRRRCLRFVVICGVRLFLVRCLLLAAMVCWCLLLVSCFVCCLLSVDVGGCCRSLCFVVGCWCLMLLRNG